MKLWTPDRGPMPIKALRASMYALARREETGFLYLSGPGTTDTSIGFVQGLIVGCDTLADDWLLARLLVASLQADAGEVQEIAEQLLGEPLHEALLLLKEFDPDRMRSILEERFRDNFFLLCLGTWTHAEFLRMGIVMPANMQFGIDPMELVAEAVRWRELVRPFMARVGRTTDAMLSLSLAGSKANGHAGVVARLLNRPRTLDEVLAVCPIERYRTLAHLARLEQSGEVLIESSSFR